MKNKKREDNNILMGIIIILVIALVMGIIYLVVPKKEEEVAKNVLFAGRMPYEERLEGEDGHVLTYYEEYQRIFNYDVLTREDFNNNNYVIFELVYDPCSESNVVINSYELNNGVLKVKAKYDASCGVCAPEYMYYLIPVPKDVLSVTIEENYESRNTPHCDSDVAYKPMIYLYPTYEMKVSVKLLNSDLLTTTYPKYNSSWEVLANPNGDLYDENGRYYYGLYWEGVGHFTKVEKDGFVVKGEDTREFLEEKLEILGLTEREADEFIIYWLPKLENNKYNYIRFETLEEINNYMPLQVNPVPDTVIRVLMDYKALDEKIDVEEQQLTRVERYGFTLVEWGGSVID